MNAFLKKGSTSLLSQLKISILTLITLLISPSLIAEELKVRSISLFELSQITGIDINDTLSEHLFLQVLNPDDHSQDFIVVPRRVENDPEFALDRPLYLNIESLLAEALTVDRIRIKKLLQGLTGEMLPVYRDSEGDLEAYLEKIRGMITTPTPFPVPERYLPYVKFAEPTWENEKPIIEPIKATPDPDPYFDEPNFVDFDFSKMMDFYSIPVLVGKLGPSAPEISICEGDIVQKILADIQAQGPLPSPFHKVYPHLNQAKDIIRSSPQLIAFLNRMYHTLCLYSHGEHPYTGLPTQIDFYQMLQDWEKHLEKLRLISVAQLVWTISFTPDEELDLLRMRLADQGVRLLIPKIPPNLEKWRAKSANFHPRFAAGKDLEIVFFQNILLKEDSYNNSMSIGMEFPFQSIKDMIHRQGSYFWLPLDIGGRFFLDGDRYFDLDKGIGLNLCLLTLNADFSSLEYASCQGKGIIEKN